MSNFYLEFIVNGMSLAKKNCPTIIDGNYKFVHAKFEFTKDWNGIDKFLLVARNNETYSVKLESDECLINYEAISTAGKFDMQVVGSKDDVRVVTNALTISVKSSEMANNPAGEESRFTNDFIITSLAEINAKANETKEIFEALPETITEYIQGHMDELKGEKGDKGDQGIQGIKGEKGDTGAIGPKGDKGDKGATGSQGPRGEQGIQGVAGPKGDKGDQGEPGKDGVIPAESLAQINANTEAINQQSGEIMLLKQENADQERRLKALADMGKGILYKQETIASESHSVTVPSGAKAFKLNSISGKSYVENNVVGFTMSPNQTFTQDGITVNRNANGSFTVSGTATASRTITLGSTNFATYIKDHKYLFVALEYADASVNTYRIFFDNIGTHTKNTIKVASVGNVSTSLKLTYAQGVTIPATTFYLVICDLSVKYGVGNEPTDVNTAINELTENEKLYSNLGGLQSVTTNAVTVVGKNLVENYTINSASNALNQFTDSLFVEADLKPNTVYTLSFDSSVAGNSYYVNENGFTYKTITVVKGKNSIPLTTKADLDKNNYYHYMSGKGWRLFKNNKLQTNSLEFTNLQIEENTVATDYSPYTEQSYPITPIEAQNLKSALAIADVAEYYEKDGESYCDVIQNTLEIDTSSLSGWIFSAWGDLFRGYIYLNKPAKIPSPASIPVNMISDKFLAVGSGKTSGIWFHSTATTQFNVMLSNEEWQRLGITDTSTFNNWIAQNPIKFIYELAEPIKQTYKLDGGRWYQCEAGGTITFENAENSKMPIANENEYFVFLNEVN